MGIIKNFSCINDSQEKDEYIRESMEIQHLRGYDDNEKIVI